MIVAGPTYTTIPKLGIALQNGDVIVSPHGIFTEVYTVIDPSPKSAEFVDVVTDKGTLLISKKMDQTYTVLDDVSLNAYYN